jgi:conjugal transfer/entry exclusion protein
MKNFNGIKVGDKLKIVAHTSGHSYPMNAEVTVINIQYVNNPTPTIAVNGTNTTGSVINQSVYAADVELAVQTREQIQQEIKFLQENIDLYNIKLDYLNKSGLDSYDDLQFKAYSTLQLLKDDNKSDIEKSLILAKLIRGE